MNAARGLRRVLIVSYYFPPDNFIGTLRTGKFAKYLQENNWEPWVLTVETGLLTSVGSLPVEIPSERVIRAGFGKWLTALIFKRRNITPAINGERSSKSAIPNFISFWRRVSRCLWVLFSGLFSDVRSPDRASPWVFPALQLAVDLLQRVPFDVVFSSHGPPSSHIVAALLTRRFGLPWIADYRDLWSENHAHHRSWPLRVLEMHLERWVLSRASHLTTVSEPLAVRLRMLHGKSVTVIQNGFDPDDFCEVTELSEKHKFRVVYTGMIYPGKQDPSIIFQAIKSILNNHQELGAAIEVHFLGADPSQVFPFAEAYGVLEHVTVHARLPNADALRWQQESDILLLLTWHDKSANGYYTGKVFEYLGARRPILATGPSGSEVEKLLIRSQSGQLATDATKAEEFILKQWSIKLNIGSTLLAERKSLLKPYTRGYQAGILAQVLDRIVENSRTKDLF